jgi:hypothetical protein
MELYGRVRTLLIATGIVWLSAVAAWLVIDIAFVQGIAVILALISTTTIWSMWALNEYGISVDGTPHPEKAKRSAGDEGDARLGLLLSLLTPDERDSLRARIVKEMDAEGEVVPLADLLAEQSPDDAHVHKG